MATHKLLPGRTVALEALLDQLGILLQRLISLESWYGDMRDYPRSISRKPWGSHLGLPYYGTKSATEMFPQALATPWPESNGRILLIHRKKHNDVQGVRPREK
jgi:hypothetical protein